MKGSEIRDLREKLGMKQAEFGKALGVSFATVSRWESGEGKPTDAQLDQLDMLKQLAERSEISKDALRKSILTVGLSGVILGAICLGMPIAGAVAGAIGGLLGKHGLGALFFNKNEKKAE